MAVNRHNIEIAALQEGDVVKVDRSFGLPAAEGMRLEERVVVRVIQPDGAMGGIVDLRRVGRRPSPGAGFEFGHAIVEVVSMAAPR